MNISNRAYDFPACFRRGIAFASLAVCLGASAPAHADGSSDSDRANLLFKKGKVAYNDGKYADALRIYEEAWRLKQSPDIAANLAQTETELGKHRDAAEHFAFALAHLLPSSTDEQKRALADGLEAEKRLVGTLHVTLEPADSKLNVDGAVVSLPPSGDLFVDSGEHRCSVTHEGYESNTQVVQVSRGASRVLWIKLNAPGGAGPAPSGSGSEPSAPPPITIQKPRSLVPAFIGGGVAVAGAAVGVAFLISGNSKQHDADQLRGQLSGTNACGAGSPYQAQCAELHSKNSSVDSARHVEVAGFAVAGVAAVGTAVYLLWPHETATISGSIRPSFVVAPGVGSVSFSGRF